MMIRIIALTTALGLVSGCATVGNSLILGAGSGAAAGAAVGLAAGGGKAEPALIGSAVGAAVGGGIAYLVHKGIAEHDAEVRKETLFGLENFGVSEVPSDDSSVPAVAFRVVEEQKIPTHREGNKVIESHRIWYLSDDSNIRYLGESGSDPKK